MTTIRAGEREARQILLARAIEIVDTQGRLISDAERDKLDVAAGEVARGHAGKPLDVRAALRSRAVALLELVGRRNPGVVSLQELPPWRSVLVAGLPLLALVLGFSSDVIANPHRLDLVSLPLLAVILWNLTFFVLLALRTMVSIDPLESRLRRVTAMLSQVRRFSGHTRAEVTATFLAAWQTASARLFVSRLTLALHLAAAAWAVGAVLSLFVRGFPYEYKVGWESTWLSAEGVRALLDFLFLPATALLGLAPFTLQEIEAMKFGAGATGSLEAAQRWVFLYSGSLAIVVIVPRLVLALVARIHEGALASRVAIDLDDPYFQQLIDRLVPSQVRVVITTHRDADSAALDRVLRQQGDPENPQTLIVSPIGDALRIAQARQAPAAPSPVALPTWWERTVGRRSDDPDAAMSEEDLATGEVVLHVIGDAADLEQPAHSSEGGPPNVLLLVNPGVDDAQARAALIDQCQLHQKHHPSIAEVLPFDAFARCWVQEPRLLEAIANCAPPSQTQGARRLAVAWSKRNAERFRQAMSILADGLLRAARETEEIERSPFSLRDIISKEHREARDAARGEAMGIIVERLKHDGAATLRRLLELHRMTDTPVSAIEQGLEVKVAARTAVDATQAGIAGAASGAAVGASVDLITGGLTLGVAAMLGALVGGGAALASAAWNNRKTPNGATTIFLSDSMLQALVEASLLRYLGVIHALRNTETVLETLRPSWNSEVVAVVQLHRDPLASLWKQAREATDPVDIGSQLTEALETIALKLLRTLYPAERLTT